jgi:hypothetical protein
MWVQFPQDLTMTFLNNKKVKAKNFIQKNSLLLFTFTCYSNISR